MPLGSRKFVVNKNNFKGEAASNIAPVSFSITETFTEDYLTSAGYIFGGEYRPTTMTLAQRVTFNITSNRPNATIDYAFVGNVSVDDFQNTTSLTGTITTDIDGSATITKVIDPDVSLNNNNFVLQLKRINSSEVIAESANCKIYSIEYPNITVTGSNVSSTTLSANSVFYDGNLISIYDDANIHINSLGTIQSNVFQTLIGANPTYAPTGNWSMYKYRPLPICLIGGGGGGDHGVGGGGGGAGELIHLKDTFVSQLQETTYQVAVGKGGERTANAVIQGGNTYVFANTVIELKAEGGKCGTGSTGGSSGNIAGGGGFRDSFVWAGGGGSNRWNIYKQYTNQTFNNGIPGRGGYKLQMQLFTSLYSAIGGQGGGIYDAGIPLFIQPMAQDFPWYNRNALYPMYIATYAMGGGGGAVCVNGIQPGEYETPGYSGEYTVQPPIVTTGRGGSSTLPAVNGRTNTGNGGGGAGTDGIGAKGADGVVWMRIPIGPNFRFVTDVEF